MTVTVPRVNCQFKNSDKQELVQDVYRQGELDIISLVCVCVCVCVCACVCVQIVALIARVHALSAQCGGAGVEMGVAHLGNSATCSCPMLVSLRVWASASF